MNATKWIDRKDVLFGLHELLRLERNAMDRLHLTRNGFDPIPGEILCTACEYNVGNLRVFAKLYGIRSRSHASSPIENTRYDLPEFQKPSNIQFPPLTSIARSLPQRSSPVYIFYTVGFSSS